MDTNQLAYSSALGRLENQTEIRFLQRTSETHTRTQAPRHFHLFKALKFAVGGYLL